MLIDDYQTEAAKTAIYPGSNNGHMAAINYCTLGLVGEAGELANKLKKVMRDYNGVMHDDLKVSLADELGDVLWYVSQLAKELGFNLDHIAMMNLGKLCARKEKGTLRGSGDDR